MCFDIVAAKVSGNFLVPIFIVHVQSKTLPYLITTILDNILRFSQPFVLNELRIVEGQDSPGPRIMPPLLYSISVGSFKFYEVDLTISILSISQLQSSHLTINLWALITSSLHFGHRLKTFISSLNCI